MQNKLAAYILQMIHSATPASPVPSLGFHSAFANNDWTTSWSDLTSFLLDEAEKRYGPRDPRWFFTGIEFADISNPQTYYTGNRPFHVGIQLTVGTAMSPKAAHFELAHEVVHLLGPSETHASANVLEEGMAALFQQEMSELSGLGINVNGRSYVTAMTAVKELLTTDAEAVRNLRATYPDLRFLNSAELLRISPEADSALAELLCSKFASLQPST